MIAHRIHGVDARIGAGKEVSGTPCVCRRYKVATGGEQPSHRDSMPSIVKPRAGYIAGDRYLLVLPGITGVDRIRCDIRTGARRGTQREPKRPRFSRFDPEGHRDRSGLGLAKAEE